MVDMNETATIQAVFLDFDGTVFSHRTSRIPASTIRAIDILHDKGIRVFLCSGRAKPELDDFDLSALKVDGMILSNGQVVIDSEGRIIYEQTIEGPLRERLVSMFREKILPIYFGNMDGLYLNFINDDLIRVQNEVSSSIPPIRDIGDDKIYMASVFIRPEESELLSQLKEYGEVTFWSDRSVDIVPKGSSKINGIDGTLKHYGIDLSATLAAGDGENDIGMLKHCARSIAMGNAIDEVKDVADYVTDDIDDDGLYNALKHYGLV